MIDLITAAKGAERCQRNWSDESVKPEDLNKIIEVATTVPTKQNLPIYRLVAITDRELNHKIVKEAAYQEHDVLKYNQGIQNPQLDSPVVLIWLGNASEIKEHIKDAQTYKEDLYTSVGISSSAAALTANSLGYQTGFCKCMINNKLNKILESLVPDLNEYNNFICALGIGKAMPGVDHTHGYWEGELTHVHPSYQKTINVTRL